MNSNPISARSIQSLNAIARFADFTTLRTINPHNIFTIPEQDIIDDDDPDEEHTSDCLKYISATVPPQLQSVYNLIHIQQPTKLFHTQTHTHFSTNPPSNEGALLPRTHSSAGEEPEEEQTVEVATVLERTKLEQLLSEPYEFTNKVPLVKPLGVQLFITNSLLSL